MWCAERIARALGVAALGAALWSPPAPADVYRYREPSGAETFTDCPVEAGSQLILREATPGSARQSGGGGRRRPLPARKISALAPAPPLPVDGVITSLAGPRHDPIDGTLREHQGIDIAVPEGTPVHPVAAGQVIFSGNRGGYGNAVIVDHGDGRTTLYAHNQSNWVGVGESVTPGDILALSGSTGRSTGPHVHFAMWRTGANVTDDYLLGLGPLGPAGGPTSGEDVIRRILQADGSILFTNLPSPTP